MTFILRGLPIVFRQLRTTEHKINDFPFGIPDSYVRAPRLKEPSDYSVKRPDANYQEYVRVFCADGVLHLRVVDHHFGGPRSRNQQLMISPASLTVHTYCSHFSEIAY
jgi:hypothetical protein